MAIIGLSQRSVSFCLRNFIRLCVLSNRLLAATSSMTQKSSTFAYSYITNASIVMNNWNSVLIFLIFLIFFPKLILLQYRMHRQTSFNANKLRKHPRYFLCTFQKLQTTISLLSDLSSNLEQLSQTIKISNKTTDAKPVIFLICLPKTSILRYQTRHSANLTSNHVQQCQTSRTPTKSIIFPVSLSKIPIFRRCRS